MGLGLLRWVVKFQTWGYQILGDRITNQSKEKLKMQMLVFDSELPKAVLV